MKVRRVTLEYDPGTGNVAMYLTSDDGQANPDAHGKVADRDREVMLTGLRQVWRDLTQGNGAPIEVPR